MNFHGACLAAVLLAGMAHAARADDATNRAIGPREYTNRVQFYRVDLDTKGPERQTPRETPGQGEGSDLSGDLNLGEVPQPILAPQPPRVPSDRRKKDNKKNWLDPTGKDAAESHKKNSSGWGWLADDVMKASKAEQSATQDMDSAESEKGEGGPVAGRDDKKDAYFMDAAFLPHLAPDLYREKASDRHDEQKPDQSGSSQVDVGIRHEAPVLTPAEMEPVAESEGLYSSPDDHPSYSPQFVSPTPMPGEVATFESISPSLGGLDAGSGHAFAPISDSGGSTLFPEAPRSQESSMGASSDASGDVRPVTLPW